MIPHAVWFKRIPEAPVPGLWDPFGRWHCCSGNSHGRKGVQHARRTSAYYHRKGSESYWHQVRTCLVSKAKKYNIEGLGLMGTSNPLRLPCHDAAATRGWENTQRCSSVCPNLRLGVGGRWRGHIELQAFGRNNIILSECVCVGLLLAGTLCCIGHMPAHSTSWEPDCWPVHPPLLCDHAWLWLGCIRINGVPRRQPAIFKKSAGRVSHLSVLLCDQLADTRAVTLGFCGTSRRHIFLFLSSWSKLNSPTTVYAPDLISVCIFSFLFKGDTGMGT